MSNKIKQEAEALVHKSTHLASSDQTKAFAKQITELVQDKHILDWLEHFYKNPDEYTLDDCYFFYKGKEKIGLRGIVLQMIVRDEETTEPIVYES